MEQILIDNAVAELWKVGMKSNFLFQSVKDKLKHNSSVEVTKPKFKAAKLVIPYSVGDGCLLSEERINFVNSKINERQNYRRMRQFKDADYIQRGLEKMGVVLNDAHKSWSYESPEKEQGDDIADTLIEGDVLKNNNGILCEMCGHIFKSRNLVFKHIRDPGSSCGNSIFVAGQKMPTAPSTEKKKEKKEKASSTRVRPRARTGRSAQHASNSSSVWMGDLPLPWTRVGGKYKRLRAFLRQYLPRDVPQPWVKVVVRKAYRKRSDTSEKSDKKEKDEYLGYAIVVFRCDEEAELILKGMDGLSISPNDVFRSDEMNDDQLSQMPSFQLKIRKVENSDSSMIPGVSTSSVKDPPLSEQLRPFTINELENRIRELKINHDIQEKQVNFKDDNNKSNQSDDDQIKTQTHIHENILGKTVAIYNSIGPRKEIKSMGRLVPDNITKPLLKILEALRWSVPNDRRHLTAERYLVLPTNVTNDRFYGNLREACTELMQWTDKSYFYSGIAVTKNFVSSPHIDDRDQSYQYALSLGDFEGGM